MEPILIDGSKGGQVLRSAIGLSALTQKPVKIEKIRLLREKPGLQPQHLTAVQLLSQLCAGKVQGAVLNSQTVLFEPQKLVASQLVANTGTAGSVSLLLESVLIPSLLVKNKLRLTGGTNVPWSPPIEFLEWVLFPVLKRMGVKCEAELSARGYYPKGRGAVIFSTRPAVFPLKPVSLQEAGSLQSVSLVSHCSSLPSTVANRQVLSAKKALSALNVDFVEEVSAKENGYSKGSGLSLFARFSSGAVLSASALGLTGKTAEAVGLEAAKKLLNQLDLHRPVDMFLADQLVPFMALAKGKSKLSVTQLDEHVFSNIDVCEKLLDCRFEVTGKVNEPGEIFCQGATFVPEETIF